MTSRPVVFLSQILCLTILFLGLNCRHSTEPPPPPPNGPDTTSHGFVWTTNKFGEGNTSTLNDVAILNDRLAFAVGQIYLKDSVGQLDGTPYSIASWNGSDWQPKKIFYGTNNVVSPIRGIWPVSETDIWLAAGSVFHWTGSGQQAQLVFSRLNLSNPNGTVEKIAGEFRGNLFAVGNAGTIVIYSDNQWAQQTSPTTMDFKDVWGNSDGTTVWACGYSNDYSQSVLLKISGQSVQQSWSRQGTATQPFGDQLTSIWGKDHLFLTSNYGVFRQGMSDTVGVERVFSLISFPYRIRGSAENNIAVSSEEGRIWHYNGATWKLLYESPGVSLYSIAVSANTIVAVGCDFNFFPPKAVIFRGARMQ